MRPNALISIVGAVVLAVAALLLARSWLDGETKRRADPGMSTVVVAAKPLTFGQRIGLAEVRQVRWPANAIPDGAFKTVEELGLDKVTRAALQPLVANEPLIRSKITGPEQRATLSAVLTPGKRAFSIRVNDVGGVGGFVLPDDRVDVILVRAPRQGEAREEFVSELLLQNVRVLGIDQDADAAADRPKVVKAVTLEVTPQETQVLSLATQSGSITLSLRNQGESELTEARTVTSSDLRSGLALAQPTVKPVAVSSRPVRRRPVRAEVPSSGAGVVVVRGDASSSVLVRRE